MMAATIFWLCAFSIVYVWFGYPAVLFAAARLKQIWQRLRPQMFLAQANQPLPSVSLIIAAHNEEAVIGAKVENSLALDYPPDKLQIIIADDGSEDATSEIVRRYLDRGVILDHDSQRRGKSAAVDRAVKNATGEIFLFSDANNMFPPEALRALVKPFSDARVGGVNGEHILQGDSSVGASEGLYWKYEAFIRRQEAQLGTAIGVTGDVLAMRAALYESIPSHVINQDFYIAMRILKQGYNVAFAPKAKSYEEASPAIEDEIRRRTRIIAGRYQAIVIMNSWMPWRRPFVCFQIFSKKISRPFIAWAMIGALLANIWAVAAPLEPRGAAWIALAAPYNWLFLAFQVVFYLVALLGLVLGKGESRLSKLIYLPTYFVGNNLAAMLGLFKYVFGRQQHIWQRTRRAEEYNQG